MTNRFNKIEDFGSITKKYTKDKYLILFLCFGPLLIYLLGIWLFPILYSFTNSFFRQSIEISQFEGLSNYATLLKDPYFWNTVSRSVIFAVSSTVITLVLGLGLALTTNEVINDHGILTTLLITTYLIPVIATVLMWQFMLDQNIGVINQLLVDIGLTSEAIPFFSSPTFAMPAVILIAVWKFTPFTYFIVLARLQSLDETMHAKARIQGASSWQSFRDITVPQLRGVIFLILLIRGVYMFNKYDLIWIATSGGPANRTTTLPIYIYNLAFNSIDFGAATALGSILFIFLGISASLYFWAFSPSEEVTT